jgi:hypothetical protein
MPRKLNEIIAQIRACVANPAISTTLIQTEDLEVLCDAAEEIERLRAALEKIAGRREYERADYEAAARYRPEEGVWTVDEYLADAALIDVKRVD